jgi:hypothetical protein
MNSPFVKTGLPIVAFCVLGAYGLAKLNQGRFDSRERERKRLEMADTTRKKEVFDLEKEYQNMLKEVDLDKWEPKRVPRP